MPNLFSSLRECFGFSQIIISQSLRALVALILMSFKFPIGVETIERPLIKLFIFFIPIFIFIISCTPVNLGKQAPKNTEENTLSKKIDTNKPEVEIIEKKIDKQDEDLYNGVLDTTIIVLFAQDDDTTTKRQFLNTFELGIDDLNVKNLKFQIENFENNKDLDKIIKRNLKQGRVFIGPIQSKYTKNLNNYCSNNVIFFSFSSNTSYAKNCIYLLNFFPKNELTNLLLFLNEGAKVALLYPENEYGYLINSFIDDLIFSSSAILVNRSSYHADLSNVRNAIKELGKYELRKYELNRQKKILSNKNDKKSKHRLKKLQKFKTTSDYDFTHILIADYGLNLLQVAPLLPYYDIDPNIVQFMGTGVIDDKTFFYEPSLQGAIFPGVPEVKRINLINKYQEIYEEEFLRVSTLAYDLIGLINFIYSKQYNFKELINLLNNSNKKFDGIDGNFFFNNNLIERELYILRINQGESIIIN